MKTADKKKVLDVLNSLEALETNGGEDAYILVENDKETHKLLNEVGVTSETINAYGDEETFCVLALGFGEGYCDLYEFGKLIAFDESIEVEIDNDKTLVVYKHDGKYFVSISENNGQVLSAELTDEGLRQLKKLVA